LLPLSDFTITLSKSTDYLRCAVLVHVLAALLLLRSALPFLLVVVIVIVLTTLLISICCYGVPTPTYHKLSYHPGYWLLHTRGGQQMKYDVVSIGFDGGMFILLTFSGENKRKNLVIFKDQLTVDQYRILKFVDKQTRVIDSTLV